MTDLTLTTMNIGRYIKKVFRIIGYMLLFSLICVFAGSIIRSLRAPVQRNPQSTAMEWSERSYGYAPHPDDFSEAII